MCCQSTIIASTATQSNSVSVLRNPVVDADSESNSLSHYFYFSRKFWRILVSFVSLDVRFHRQCYKTIAGLMLLAVFHRVMVNLESLESTQKVRVSLFLAT